jgi:hypothetical protein
VRKIDPNKSPEDVDALIRLGLMIEKHKDVVTEELDEDGESERSIRICSFSASAAAHQPEWTPHCRLHLNAYNVIRRGRVC